MMQRISITIFSTVFIVGCTHNIPPDGTGHNTFSKYLNGYLCSATPSTAFSPGFVYRVDQQGSELLVVDLADKAVTKNYRAADGTYSANLTQGGGLQFSLTSGAIHASAGVSSESVGKSTLSFKNGRFAMMNDSDEEALIESFKSKVKWRADSRYFLVRDAIQANGVTIDLSQTDEAKLGGDVGINKIVSVTPNAKLSRSDTAVISADLVENLNVCIRAVEISVPPPFDPYAPTPVMSVVGAPAPRNVLSAESLAQFIGRSER